MSILDSTPQLCVSTFCVIIMNTLLLLWVLILSSLSFCSDSNRIVCYMTNWSKFRRGRAKFQPEDINPNLCTHIIYAYAIIVNYKVVPRYTGEDDLPGQEGMYKRVLSTKKYNPAIKVLLSVGGDGAGTTGFEQVSENSTTMRTFAEKAAKFVRQRGFDGLEVFWAYPTAKYSRNFLDLMQDLRYAFDDEAKSSGKPMLILTIPMSSSLFRIQQDYGDNIFSLITTTDFVSVMTYDFHGKWDETTGMNAPLYPKSNRDTLNVDYIVKYYLKQGVPKHLINIGIPTYAITFHLKNPRQYYIGSPVAGPGPSGQYTGRMGLLAYYEVCKFIYSGASVYDDELQKVRFATKGYNWVSFEDADSVTTKACYARTHNYGGVSIWTLDYDDFNNICGSTAYPLVTAVYNATDIESTTCPSRSFLKAMELTSGADKPIQSKTLHCLQLPLLWSIINFFN